MFKQFETMIGDRKLIVETGKYAEQAGGSCLVRCGGTAVLVCATVSKAPRDGVDFLPLSIEFEEKLYSVGKIPGGFIKREGRPSEKAILTDRLIDRPLRPLFPKGFYNDVDNNAETCEIWGLNPGETTKPAGNWQKKSNYFGKVKDDSNKDTGLYQARIDGIYTTGEKMEWYMFWPLWAAQTTPSMGTLVNDYYYE